MWDDTDRRQATCSFHFVKHFLSHFFIIKGCSFIHSTAKSATRLLFSDLVNWKCFFFNLIVDYSNCTQNECIKVSVCKSLRGAIVSMISHSLHVASCHHFFFFVIVRSVLRKEDFHRLMYIKGRKFLPFNWCIKV